MFGILIFQQVFMNLGENCRNRVLGNIFDICNVSISSVSVREEEVIFRVFSEGVFYQFVFLLEGRNKGSFFKVCSGRNIVHSLILLSDYKDNNKNDFIYQLIELFRGQDEYQIYQIMRLFL